MENFTDYRPPRPLLGTARRGVYDTLQQRKALDGPETITNRSGDTMDFDIARFHYIAKDFNKATSSVPMNRAGEALRFYPEKGWKKGRTVCFEARNELGRLRTTWSPDPDYPADIRVESVFYPTRKGYYSVSTPTLAILPEERLGWSVVPGFFKATTSSPYSTSPTCTDKGCPTFRWYATTIRSPR